MRATLCVTDSPVLGFVVVDERESVFEPSSFRVTDPLPVVWSVPPRGPVCVVEEVQLFPSSVLATVTLVSRVAVRPVWSLVRVTVVSRVREPSALTVTSRSLVVVKVRSIVRSLTARPPRRGR